MTPDVARVHDDLAALAHDAERLTAPLSPPQLNFQPDEGRRWSIAQNLDHLAKANGAYLDAMAPALRQARHDARPRRDDLRSTWCGRWFLSTLEPPPRFRARAPGSIQPASRFDGDDVVARFLATIARARQELAESADVDLNAARFRNPLLSLLRVRASTGFRVIAAHGRRHLWQARQVLSSEGFPR